MKPILLLLALAAVVGLAVPAAAQAQDLIQSIRQGGGWIEIPIEGGTGSVRTEAVPTFGLTVSGCANVWPGHTGEFNVQARDLLNGGRLAAVMTPGKGVPFSYRTGLRTSLDVRVRWSEPRDTTLLIWVGLEGTGASRGNPCAPVYGTGTSLERSSLAGSSQALLDAGPSRAPAGRMEAEAVASMTARPLKKRWGGSPSTGKMPPLPGRWLSRGRSLLGRLAAGPRTARIPEPEFA